MYRLGHFVNGDWTAHSFPPVFYLTQYGDSVERLVASVPAGDPAVFGHLVECLSPPCYLLYVLHTPRGEGAAGRYQSPPLTLVEIRGFLSRFGAFLSADGRYDLWAHSRDDDATVVWDRHNRIFAYGPLDAFSSRLRSLGFAQGDVTVPAPHQHSYRAEFDEMAKEVLSAFDWSHTALRPGDEQ
jgi:hypothetical protein